MSSRPLWSIYISILRKIYLTQKIQGSRPLWGIYISIPKMTFTIGTKKSWFSSPMGYLYFYSANTIKYAIFQHCSRPLWGIYISILMALNFHILKWLLVLVPYGVSIFLFKHSKNGLQKIWLVLVPYGVSIFLFIFDDKGYYSVIAFSSPMGYLYFYSCYKRKVTTK